MSNTQDHISIISSDPTGATIATDYHSTTQRHWQVVKLNMGGDGTDALLSNTNPLPVSYTISAGQPFVPISGNTAGTTSAKVYVEGGAISADVSGVTISVGDITVIGGTIDGGWIGVTFAAGSTIDAVTTVTTVTTITNDVGITAPPLHVGGGTIGVQTVAIPTIPYGGHVTAGTGVTWLGSTTAFVSGVRITNNGPDPVYVGQSGVNTASGYKMNNLDSIWLEVSGATSVHMIVAAGGASSDIRWIGS